MTPSAFTLMNIFLQQWPKGCVIAGWRQRLLRGVSATTAFALIEEEQRIWGVGYDDLRGGHVTR